jgi:hypothetical protein
VVGWPWVAWSGEKHVGWFSRHAHTHTPTTRAHNTHTTQHNTPPPQDEYVTDPSESKRSIMDGDAFLADSPSHRFRSRTSEPYMPSQAPGQPWFTVKKVGGGCLGGGGGAGGGCNLDGAGGLTAICGTLVAFSLLGSSPYWSTSNEKATNPTTSQPI